MGKVRRISKYQYTIVEQLTNLYSKILVQFSLLCILHPSVFSSDLNVCILLVVSPVELLLLAVPH